MTIWSTFISVDQNVADDNPCERGMRMELRVFSSSIRHGVRQATSTGALHRLRSLGQTFLPGNEESGHDDDESARIGNAGAQ
ncbi:hypothetical protein ACRHM7_17380 [Chromohalobacter israelensis]|uniref:hypothetical protein n=1 Tax=Chromohalobacter israelensis TaxID=141390 RepID=UPI003D7ABB62